MTLGAISEYIVLVDIEALDPATGLTAVQRVATRDVLYEVVGGVVEYDGFLIGCNYGRSLVAPGQIRGQSVGCRGAITVANTWSDIDAGRKLDYWHDLRWQHRRVTIRVIEPGQSLDQAQVMLVGTIGTFEPEPDRFVLGLRDRQELFRRKKARAATYGGTGGMDGGAELKARKKPLGWGLVRRLPPVGVDVLVTGLWYDVISGRPLQAILGAEDGGSALTASASNPPPGGRYYVDAANGRVRLGIVPTYDLTVDARLDAGGAGYVATHASIMGRIAEYCGGLTVGEIDAASIAAIDALQPAEIGLWVGPDEDVSVADLLDAVATSAGLWWIFGRLDQLRIGRLDAVSVTAGTADLVLDAYDVVQGSLKRTAAEVPPWRVTARYRRYQLTRDKGRVATGLTEQVKQDLAAEWRKAAPWESAAVLTEYPASEPLEIDTLFDDEASAAAEASRLGTLLQGTPVPMTLTTGMQAASIDVGGRLWLTHPEQGLGAGKGFLVLGLDVDLMLGTIQMEIWRHAD